MGSAMRKPREATWESATHKVIGREAGVHSSQTRISTLETLPDFADILSVRKSPSQSVGLYEQVFRFPIIPDPTSNTLVTHALLSLLHCDGLRRQERLHPAATCRPARDVR